MTAKCSVASTVLLVSLRALDTMPFIPAARGYAEGQVQASLLKRGPEGGLLNSARILLMEGMLPSRLPTSSASLSEFDHFVGRWDTWWQILPDFFGIAGLGWTSKAPIAKAFGTRLRGISQVFIADSDITSTRVS